VLRPALALIILSFATLAHAQQSPTRTWNDDSRDIGVTPAATLLLPYFEVDFQSPPASALTTLFTVVNTSPLPQIAKVTLWTDWAYPVLTFSSYMTGYGVTSVNLRDIFAGGLLIAELERRRIEGPVQNPNILPGATLGCSGQPSLTISQRDNLQRAFTTGITNACGGSHVGGAHPNAIGYATIDVVASCSSTMPTDPAYYTTEILFDNVLIGDWELVDPNGASGNNAGGNPLVHLRAVPEGGPAGSNIPTNLPYTFYDRYTTAGGIYARTVDRRQPLPSTFAARWIQGGATGFNTDFLIWREGYTGAGAGCANYAASKAQPLTELVRFDEHENASSIAPLPFGPYQPLSPLPVTSETPTSSSGFPGLTSSGDVAGWFFINASNGGSPAYSTAPGRDFRSGSTTLVGARQNQGWITIRMTAQGRFSVMFDAASLGNGCSKTQPYTPIGPLPNANP
jgi:hypothetical protein